MTNQNVKISRKFTAIETSPPKNGMMFSTALISARIRAVRITGPGSTNLKKSPKLSCRPSVTSSAARMKAAWIR